MIITRGAHNNFGLALKKTPEVVAQFLRTYSVGSFHVQNARPHSETLLVVRQRKHEFVNANNENGMT